MERTECINGILKAGDIVLSTAYDDYPCLVGRVKGIDLLGSEGHNTGNETDDVHVDFTGNYSPRRIREIEKTFAALYGEKRAFADIPLDDVIMSPASLIRITGISNSPQDWISRSEVCAAQYGCRVLTQQLMALKDLPPKPPELRPVSGSYYGLQNGAMKEISFQKGLFHLWGSVGTELDSGGITDTAAIVELPSGAVCKVYPHNLTFLEPYMAGGKGELV